MGPRVVTPTTRRGSAPTRTVAAGTALGLVLVVVGLVAVAPLPVVLGAGRLAVLVVLATGASLTVGRAGSVDLAAGAVAGTGAYLGGVLAGLAALPMPLGLLTGAAAGAAVGAGITAVAGRVGRTLSALTSLAAAAALVAGLGAWGAAGGAAGFHAVPLLTSGDRTDLAVVLLLLLAAATVAVTVGSRRVGARASVAVHAPTVARTLGRRPTWDAALLGAVGGAILGVGGAAGAALSGSVAPAAYGLPLSAALALAVVVGGAPPLGPLVGVLLLWGPGVLWPLAPVVGDGPALLVMGPVALALRAWRGRPLLPWPEAAARPHPDSARAHPVAAPTRSEAAADADAAPPRTVPPVHRLRGTPATLVVRGFPLPHGGRLELEAEPGTVTAVVGPNGSGKSTLLAAVAGQVADHGSVRWGSGTLPPGATRRAARGIARTWQTAPGVPPDDALVVAVEGAADAQAAAEVRALLGAEADRRAGRQLEVLAARRPALALLDEPAADLPAASVARVLRWLADTGATVLVVEHRPELVAGADRVVSLGPSVTDERQLDGRQPDERQPEQQQPDERAGGPSGGSSRPRLHVELDGPRGVHAPDPAVLEVAAGEVVWVDDPRVVAAVTGIGAPPGRHRIRLDGQRIDRRGAAGRVAAGLGVVADASVAGDVSVRDHLAVVVPPGRAEELLAGCPPLAGRGGDPAGWLSGGERRLLAWLRCDAVQPRAVVLDGAFRGLDAQARTWAEERLAAWRDRGAAVLRHEPPG